MSTAWTSWVLGVGAALTGAAAGAGAGVTAGGGGGAPGVTPAFRAIGRLGEVVMEIRGSVPGGKGSVVFWVRAGGVDSGGTNARNGGAPAGFDCGLLSREDT